MRRLSLVAVLFCVTVLLSACQLSGGKTQTGTEEGVTPNAVAGSAIEVTPLDAPPVEAEAPNAAGTDLAGRETAAPEAAPATEETASGAEAQATNAPPQKPDLAEELVTPKSDVQLSCEKKGSKWFKIGDGEKYACVRETKDSGKRCEKESQCDGVCLARSGTCSPFKPLYGCNEILQDDGARVTLCLD
jgi:hypothetical protein